MRFRPRFLCALIGYVLGSILSAELVARKMTKKSARQIGSGNPGMTNIMLNLGKTAGLAVLAGDILKTLAALLLSWRAAGEKIGKASLLWGGLGTILGHNFSFLSRFKGGKGVAVTCAWLIVCMPLWGTLCCLTGAFVCLITGYLPVGAVLIPALAVIPGFLAHGKETGCAFLAAALMMFSRHRRGLRRVIEKREKKFFH